MLAIARLVRREQPDILHLVTIKPVLYGGIAARLLGVPGVVSAISGMGYLFTEGRSGLLQRLSRLMYRLALRHPHGRVIVQNEADRDALRAMGALREGADVLIPGSGVDLDVYSPSPIPSGDSPIVLLPARMLWDKGVGEFVEAARQLLEQGVKARFVLAGPYDPHNPAAVPEGQLQTWQAQGPVEWWGQQEDMPRVLAAASLVVLPSYYREGVPKALLEALACGRPVVTTDAPGCRDVVEPGKNGELIPVRDAAALARAIGELLSDRSRLEAMGRYGRLKAEREFGVERVVEAHLAIYRSLERRESGVCDE
ncbi:Glycosyltransferase involved in cell wall bisynthesis [Ectothiorhodospira marina]|uniref:Glycosyltransferase involved in cell wall bisynthesis n=1 Tax=Ectothiorhodospira marina TaxID=1396821 RepID=A0A1H7RKH5_9GAMM|nr:Glycosyltransferase involved in cell wall bisynthesis [Ectothiorhodospira marina]